MKPEEVIERIKEIQPNSNLNRMGCSENWYDFFYAMKKTFTEEEILNMSEREIDLLEKLAINIQDALY